MDVHVLQLSVVNLQVFIHNIADIAIHCITMNFDIWAYVGVFENDATKRDILQTGIGPNTPDRGAMTMWHAGSKRGSSEVAIFHDHMRGVHRYVVVPNIDVRVMDPK